MVGPGRGHGRDEHEARRVGPLRRLEHVAGAVAVGHQKVGFAPRGDGARHVIDDVLSFDGLPEGGAVVQVARHDADAERCERRRLGRRARECRDLIAAAAESFGEVAADEARRPGDQRLHIGRSYSRYVLYTLNVIFSSPAFIAGLSSRIHPASPQ